jgi:hypothetical protein
LPGERSLWLRFTSGGRNLLCTVYPAVLAHFLPEGSQPTRAPLRLFLVRRVCVPCHPGAARKLAEASFVTAFRKVALSSKLPALPHSNRLLFPPGAEALGMTTIRNAEPADNGGCHGAEALRVSPVSVCGCCRVGVPLVQQTLQSTIQVPAWFDLPLGRSAPASAKTTASLPWPLAGFPSQDALGQVELRRRGVSVRLCPSGEYLGAT